MRLPACVARPRYVGRDRRFHRLSVQPKIMYWIFLDVLIIIPMERESEYDLGED